MKQKLPIVLIASAVLTLSVLPFIRTTTYGLVNLDDYQYTIGSAHLTDAPFPVALSWLLTSRDDAIWMPVTRLSYLLDCRIWNESPRAMHAVNVLFHGLNAALLFLLLAKLGVGVCKLQTGNWTLETGGSAAGSETETPDPHHARLTEDGSPYLSAQAHEVGRGVPAEPHSPPSPVPVTHCDPPTKNSEHRIQNPESRTPNQEPRTTNPEPPHHSGLTSSRNPSFQFPVSSFTSSRFTSSRPSPPVCCLLAAALAALFWAVHPLRVESVAWVASRKDVLSLFFELLALIFWIKRLDHDTESKRSEYYGWAALVTFVLAGMAKPTAMTFPILAGLLELLRSGWKIRWRDYVVPAVLACVIGVVAQRAQSAGGAMDVLSRVPLYGRLLNAAAAFGIYCWKTLWPTGLAVQCIHRWPALPRFWAEGLAICAAYGLVLLWSARRIGLFRLLSARAHGVGRGAPSEPPSSPSARDSSPRSPNQEPRTTNQEPRTSSPLTSSRFTPLVPRSSPPNSLNSFNSLIPSPLPLALFVSLSWFLMSVAPMLGLANYGLHAFADRFTYLPAVGFSILLAFALSRWASRPAGRLALVLACGVTLLFGFMADRQSRYWRNEQVLFEHTLEVDGRQNHMILGTLGLHYYEFDGDLPKAREYMDAAFAKTISRELASFHFIYIEVLAESGMIDRAWEEAQRVLTMREGEALKQRPEQYDGRVMTDGMRALIYAIISLAEGDLAAVDSHLETVDRLYPGVPHAAYLRGRLALARGDPEEAVRQWRISLDAKRSYMRHRFVEKEIRRLEHGAARP